MTDIVQSFAHGLDILMLYDVSTPCLTVSEISERLKFSQSKTYRLLRTLVRYGFLQEQEKSSKYCLGLSVLRLGILAQQRFNISFVARPFMEELRALTKETIFLIALSGTRGLCVERIESEEPVRFSSPPGDEIPLYCTAAGKVLMSHLPEEDWDRIIGTEGLKRYTSNTITSPEELKVQLKDIRSEGYAVADREYYEEERASAAPISNGSGEVVAAISISGPFYRISKSKLRGEYRRLAILYAAKISAQLGWTPG
jgi:IclR family transcriptional regulator, KDG regulon repressor